MVKILFCCYGNICRSTMAQFVLQHIVDKLGIADKVLIDSRATSDEEDGNPPHRGTVKKLNEVGIPVLPHTARQITLKDYDRFDYIIGLDAQNIRDLKTLLKGDPNGKIYKMLSFAGDERDIADPWFTGDFDATYDDVLRGCECFLEYLKNKRLI